MRNLFLPGLWSLASFVVASLAVENGHGPGPSSCVGYDAPDCTSIACTPGEPDCDATSTPHITISSTMGSIVSTMTVPNPTIPPEITTVTVTAPDSASGFYPDNTDSITPRPPPSLHSTRSVATATPVTSTSVDSSETTSAPCTHWNPPPPAVSAVTQSYPDIQSPGSTTSSCITLTWTGSTHSDVSTPTTTATSTSSHSSSISSASRTTFTSTTSSEIGYPEGTASSSGIQGNYTGHGVKIQVGSTVAALFAVAVMPLLLL